MAAVETAPATAPAAMTSDPIVESLSPDITDLEIEDLLADYDYEEEQEAKGQRLMSARSPRSPMKLTKSCRPYTATTAARPPWKYWKGLFPALSYRCGDCSFTSK